MAERIAVGFHHVLPPDRIANIRRQGDNAVLAPATTDRGGDRRCTVGWLPDLIPQLWEIVTQINRAHFEFELTGIETPQYTLYRPGDHFNWHLDLGGGERYRKLSLTLQLSEPGEYEGGDLELYNGAETLIAGRESSDMFAFPSWALHRVSPVTQGERRSLVVWAYGDKFR